MANGVQPSSGNVFSDLGFDQEEAQNLKIRADLMIELTKLIEARGLTQAAAAKLLGVTQPRVSDLVRGKIDRFSVDSLIEMLGRAGADVSLVVSTSHRVNELLTAAGLLRALQEAPLPDPAALDRLDEAQRTDLPPEDPSHSD